MKDLNKGKILSIKKETEKYGSVFNKSSKGNH